MAGLLFNSFFQTAWVRPQALACALRARCCMALHSRGPRAHRHFYLWHCHRPPQGQSPNRPTATVRCERAQHGRAELHRRPRQRWLGVAGVQAAAAAAAAASWLHADAAAAVSTPRIAPTSRQTRGTSTTRPCEKSPDNALLCCVSPATSLASSHWSTSASAYGLSASRRERTATDRAAAGSRAAASSSSSGGALAPSPPRARREPMLPARAARRGTARARSSSIAPPPRRLSPPPPVSRRSRARAAPRGGPGPLPLVPLFSRARALRAGWLCACDACQASVQRELILWRSGSIAPSARSSLRRALPRASRREPRPGPPAAAAPPSLLPPATAIGSAAATASASASASGRRRIGW